MSRLTCSLCGFGFDPAGEAACAACPMRRGCPLVCCPACGHVTVDTERSRLVRLAAPLVHGRGARSTGGGGFVTLAYVAPGGAAVVRGFRPSTPEARREQFLAYGLAPGCRVTVVRQSPVTVVRIDHTELALEREVAEMVVVDGQR